MSLEALGAQSLAASASCAALTIEERPFNPWRVPRTANAEALVKAAIDAFLSHEHQHCPRTRKRRQADVLVFERCVSSVICDVVVDELGDRRGVHLSRSNRNLYKKGRYSPPTATPQLRHILDVLASDQMRYLRQRRCQKKTD